MSRAADLIAQFERMTTIDFIFDADKVVDANSKDLPREVVKDMERADKIELIGGGSELIGHIDRKVAFTASGFYDEGDGTFTVESYFSRALQSRDGKRFARNTTNADKFAA